jgi:hypothetical protein
MFHQLQKIHARPAPFGHYTAADLWTDEYISSKMLAYHLDGLDKYTIDEFAAIAKKPVLS